jgi:scyllo-inositol 2-dehydrogenase (NADP+)
VIRIAMVGLGKMGLSHLAILRSHPLIELVAACDATTYLTDVLARHSDLKCYSNFDRMLAEEELDAVVIATPSKFHASMVEKALDRRLHVFCEKPFVLDVENGERLCSQAEAQSVVTQVGYHFRFVGAFREAARLVQAGALGAIHHVRAEANGPVVLRVKGSTWRSSKLEGGGALYDYACHAVDLVNFIVGVPASVSGVVRHSVFSEDVEDEVYCTLHFKNGASGQLSVNWSDESFRKMSTRISVWGTNGRLTVDRQECQIYLRKAPANEDIGSGWTVRYTTELSENVWYYLRGEEYSAQIDYFVQSIQSRRVAGQNTFRSALQVDRLVSMILSEGVAAPAPPAFVAPRSRGFLGAVAGLLSRSH